MFISLLAAPLLSLCAPADNDSPAVFAAPVPLAEPAAAAVSKLLYPTPILYDLDGDGQVEMILGDLPGNLWVCERQTDGGLMGWSKPKAMKCDGKQLKFDNW